LLGLNLWGSFKSATFACCWYFKTFPTEKNLCGVTHRNLTTSQFVRFVQKEDCWKNDRTDVKEILEKCAME